MSKILLSVVTDIYGYVINFCTGAYLGDETTHIEVDYIPEDFYTIYHAYRIENGALVLDTNKIDEAEYENELSNLRMQREIECFSVVDRSPFWYKTLTEKQLDELNTWYQEWLDVTEKKRGAKSFNIPIKPDWLK